MKSTKSILGLLIIIALYYLLPLAFRNLWQPDETRYAEISREMLESGDWIVPHFLGLRYFEKPAIGYWINNLSQLLFGHTNFSVRFGSAFSISVTTLIVYWLALRFWQEQYLALTAAMIFSSFLLVYSIGTYSVLDPMLTLWLATTMCSCWQAIHAPHGWGKKIGYLIVGVTCGLGFMTKGFLALVLPILSVLPWVIVRKSWKEVLCYGPLTLLSAVMISSPWIFAIAQREPDFWHYFIWIEHIQRFAEENAQHKAPFWYYLPVFLAGALPWMALIPVALHSAWQERHTKDEALYLLGWIIMPLIFFSLSKGKLPTYILPCFTPLSLLMARYATRWGERALKINATVNVLFGVICIAFLSGAAYTLGLVDTSFFSLTEGKKELLAVMSFIVWSIVGLITLKSPITRWRWAALCPLGIALLIGEMIPQKISDTKQPHSFINMVRPQLEKSRFILTNSVGIAAGLAWELQRSDILLLEEQGELAYGLRYPDARGHFIRQASFANWLHERCKTNEGSVSLILLLDDGKFPRNNFPPADAIFQRGRMVFLTYHQSKSWLSC
ncbi:lipid IV(A) 4-amino-4-deoxy-L-arabinosyltransferase [Candidatus Steffania adelgidicola]|uniref:lipid IV(A) 4-amino-4-deoxy-L-arabinosyltransferase n=1 Tax=Candidatus Steffania adelgidicola TaxID=1076626 RepID=UPI001D015A8E|nr:lipid IV(A) 4-amino-4-deoxy-L-arabinosyltransferase [Candidatus Steffania adelgidicola]UDG79938.1 Undecaprenyl phosphate-alpha-4-amino-4-deoxy-L-arabinose arabinosyl transferase [Candidatus Steffania adelgidicola]